MKTIIEKFKRLTLLEKVELLENLEKVTKLEIKKALIIKATSPKIDKKMAIENKKILSSDVHKNMGHGLISKRLNDGWEYRNAKGFTFVLKELYSHFIIRNNSYVGQEKDFLPREFWYGVSAN